MHPRQVRPLDDDYDTEKKERGRDDLTGDANDLFAMNVQNCRFSSPVT